MPRIRQNAQKYAEEDFRKGVRHFMVDAGFESLKEVAAAAGIPHSTLCKRIQQPDTMTAREMRSLFPVVRPPAAVLLALLGYPAKEIKNMEDDYD